MQSNYCFKCKNYLGDLTCLAFPDKIPESILLGELVHDKPLKDQENEYIFEPEETENQLLKSNN